MQSEKPEGPKVSMIVAVYNAERTLRRCLDSLLSQTYRNLDLVLVDDGSTDKSGEILEEYAARDTRIQVVHQKNGGVASARNMGLAQAKGEWIGFADSDDEVEPDGVEALLSAALREGTPMSMGGFFRCVKNKRPRLVSFPDGILCGEELMRFLVSDGKNYNYMWICLCRADIFEGVSFPSGKIYEDTYLLPKLTMAAKSCAFISRPVYRYHIHRDSISGSLDIDSQLDALEAVMETKRTVAGVYPRLSGCCSALILEICCWLMGKIKAAGKKENIQSWQLVTESFCREQKTAEIASPYLKLAGALFHISPDLLGRAAQMFSFIRN